MKAIKLAMLFLIACGSAVSRGDVVDGNFYSEAPGVEKAYRVYLPAGYSQQERSYPVIYLLHGRGATERSWTDALKVHEAADRLGLQAFIAMPDGDRSLYANAVTAVDYKACLIEVNPKANPNELRDEYCVRSPSYEDYIVEDLIAEIGRNFRTVQSADGRALSGESAGGTGALSLALRNPDVFSSAASHSGIVAFLYDGPYPFESGQARFVSEIVEVDQSPEVLAVYGGDIANWRSHDPYSVIEDSSSAGVALYLDCGSEDDFQFNALAAALDELLTSKGVNHECHSVPGGHNDDLFAARIEHSLRFHMRHFEQTAVH